MRYKTKFKTGIEARTSCLEGFRKVYDNVSISLGPKGRLAIIEQRLSNKITKDGYTIAKSLYLEDPFEEEGAKIARQTSDKANTDVGDSTTTAIIVGYAASKAAVDKVNAGHNPQDLKKGMEEGMRQAVQFVKEHARAVNDDNKDSYKIALVSSNFDENVANIVSQAYEKAGTDGVITIENSNNSETTLETIDGLRFENGWLSPYFVTNTDKGIVEFDKPCYLFLDGKFDNINKLIDILNIVAQKNYRLVIVAEEFDSTVLSTIVLNRMNGLQVAAVKAPDFGEYKTERLSDMAALTGATLITEAAGLNLESFNESFFGTSDKVVITREHTTIIGKNKFTADKLEDHINGIRQALAEKQESGNKGYVYEKTQKRLASLTNGIVSIKCGALTEVLLKEAKDRIDDAVKAVASSKEEGYIAGGCTVLLAAANSIDSTVFEDYDKKLGIEVVKEALKAPIKKLLTNAGENADYIIGKLTDINDGVTGYNLLSGKYEHMIDAGILDTAKGARTAIEAGVSAGITLAIVESLIVTDNDEKQTVTPAM